MKYYEVIDTNVLVSALLKWNSFPGNVLELTYRGMIVPLLDVRIAQEYREVLARPKFHLTRSIIEDTVGELERLGIYVDSKELDIELPDLKDNRGFMILEAVRSVCSQTLLPQRIIIVDDGSADPLLKTSFGFPLEIFPQL